MQLGVFEGPIFKDNYKNNWGSISKKKEEKKKILKTTEAPFEYTGKYNKKSVIHI